MLSRSQRVVTAAFAVIFGGVALAAASAPDKKGRAAMDPRGEPEGMKKMGSECYKVWHNEDGWHVRVMNTKGSHDHKFSGTITVEGGVMEEVHGQLAKKSGGESQWKHSAKKNELTFDFSPKDKEDGVNFRCSKAATDVKFTLKIDGKDVAQEIYVGKGASHPVSASFTVAAHPGETHGAPATASSPKIEKK